MLLLFNISLSYVHRRSSQRKESHRKSSGNLRRVSFSRRKDEDEIPLVALEEPVGELDAITENEMDGFRGQIMSFSKDSDQRRSDEGMSPQVGVAKGGIKGVAYGGCNA